MKLALELHEQAQTRVSTGELNRVLAKALGARAPTARRTPRASATRRRPASARRPSSCS
jgi:predicted GTPase